MLDTFLNLCYLSLGLLILSWTLMIGILALSLVITFPDSVIRVSEKLALFCLFASTVAILFALILLPHLVVIGGGTNAL